MIVRVSNKIEYKIRHRSEKLYEKKKIYIIKTTMKHYNDKLYVCVCVYNIVEELLYVYLLDYVCNGLNLIIVYINKNQWRLG